MTNNTVIYMSELLGWKLLSHLKPVYIWGWGFVDNISIHSCDKNDLKQTKKKNNNQHPLHSIPKNVSRETFAKQKLWSENGMKTVMEPTLNAS